MSARLVTQKGLDLILGARELLSLDAQFVFLGAGEQRYEQALGRAGRAAPDRIAVQLDFTDRLEHRLMAGADIFLMPSLVRAVRPHPDAGPALRRAARSSGASAASPTPSRTA